MRHGQQEKRDAYTLLELVVALAVLAIFAAISVPSIYQSYLRFRTLDQSVNSAMNSILLAKRLAVEKSTPYAYEFVHGQHVQSIYPLRDPSLAKTELLPASVRLLGTASPPSKIVQLVFREDGSTDGFKIKIEYQSQFETVQVLRHLGFPQRTDED